MSQPPSAFQSTPTKLRKNESGESEEEGFSVFIKPKEGDTNLILGGRFE